MGRGCSSTSTSMFPPPSPSAASPPASVKGAVVEEEAGGCPQTLIFFFSPPSSSSSRPLPLPPSLPPLPPPLPPPRPPRPPRPPLPPRLDEGPSYSTDSETNSSASSTSMNREGSRDWRVVSSELERYRNSGHSRKERCRREGWRVEVEGEIGMGG